MKHQIFPNQKPQHYDAVFVILSHNKEWVLVKEKDRAWEFPGGGREGNETYIETAQRECMEEAGAVLKDIVYQGYYILPKGLTAIVLTATVDHFVPLSGNFETEDVRTFKELPEDLSFKDGLYHELIRTMNLRPS